MLDSLARSTSKCGTVTLVLIDESHSGTKSNYFGSEFPACCLTYLRNSCQIFADASMR
jgi:hypothetical protein